MSAGICLLNRNGVVLAADSAVTIGNNATVFNSANKVHKLSLFAPVGLITYANACFESIPFEIIISDYRKYLGEKKFDDLNEYVDDFIHFFESKFDLYDHKSNTNSYFERVISFVFTILKRKEAKIAKTKKKMGPADFESLVNEVVSEIDTNSYKNGFDIESIKNEKREKYIEKYSTNPDFGNYEKELLAKVIDASFRLMASDLEVRGYVGVAICGFGEKDIFPKAQHLLFLGMCGDKLNFKLKHKTEINSKTLESILPLAQTDVMTTFLFSTNDDCLNNLKQIIENKINLHITNIDKTLLSKKRKNEIIKQTPVLSKSIIGEYVNNLRETEYMPIHSAMVSLPIYEMTQFAESMINITSIRRMVVYDDYVSTVGGPIDIATITKENGFLWVKNKNSNQKE